MECNKTDCIHYKVCEEWKSLGNDNYINDSYGNCDNYAPTGSQACSECKPVIPPVDLDREIELYKSKVDFYESQNTRGEYAVTARELKFVVELLEKLRSEKPQGEWIEHSTENLLWGHNECPFCHMRSNRGAHYCQYCGAYLKGGKE